MNDQPPGVDEYDPASRPNVTDAAERILEYVSWFGDGLIDTVAGHPLFARDLDVVSQAALGGKS